MSQEHSSRRTPNSTKQGFLKAKSCQASLLALSMEVKEFRIKIPSKLGELLEQSQSPQVSHLWR